MFPVRLYFQHTFISLSRSVNFWTWRLHVVSHLRPLCNCIRAPSSLYSAQWTNEFRIYVGLIVFLINIMLLHLFCKCILFNKQR